MNNLDIKVGNQDSKDGGCLGCFLFLVLLPLALVAIYLVWEWALDIMQCPGFSCLG